MHGRTKTFPVMTREKFHFDIWTYLRKRNMPVNSIILKNTPVPPLDLDHFHPDENAITMLIWSINISSNEHCLYVLYSFIGFYFLPQHIVYVIN